MAAIRVPVDVEALASEVYPQDWQLAERLAFIRGFLTADPSKAKKAPGRARRKFGSRADTFRSLKPGEQTQVTFMDGTDWTMWRATASWLKRTYGCRFSVFRDRQDRSKLNIYRYE